MSNPINRTGGVASWDQQAGDQYVVTGRTRDGRRFRQTWSSWRQASGINLWRGSKWLLREGKRYLISRTTN